MRNKLVISLLILIVVLSCFPLFKNIHNINADIDLLQVLSYHGFARQAILEHHQFPLRTQYFGGGYPLIANPQYDILSPFFLFSLFWGEVFGIKFIIFLYHLIGALGMYYLTRGVLKYNYSGAIFSSIVFLLGGLIHRIALTHAYTEKAYFLLPLLFAFFIKSKDNKKYILYTILVLTICVNQASLNFASIALFLFLYTLLEVVKFEKKEIRFNKVYLINFFIIIFLTILLGAVRTFPMFELLLQNDRGFDAYSLSKQPGSILSQLYNYFCLGFPRLGLYAREIYKHYYLGFLPVICALFSFFLYRKETIKYAVLLAVFLMLGLGPNSPIDLFRALWHLPLYHSMDRPARYFFPLVIFLIALVSGRIFSYFDKFKRKSIVMGICVSLILFVSVDLLRTNGIWHTDVFPDPIPIYKQQDSFFQVKNMFVNKKHGPVSGKIPMLRAWETTRPTQYELMLQNIGKINWYGNIHLGEYALPKYYVDWNGQDSLDSKGYTWSLNPEYKGEIYFLNNSDNKAEFGYFSPNKIVAKVTVAQPDVLVINQNYDKYWKVYPAKPINHNGLLAVKLDKPGSYEVKFNYWPVSFYLGLAISLVTLIMLTCWFLLPNKLK